MVGTYAPKPAGGKATSSWQPRQIEGRAPKLTAPTTVRPHYTHEQVNPKDKSSMPNMGKSSIMVHCTTNRSTLTFLCPVTHLAEQTKTKTKKTAQAQCDSLTLYHHKRKNKTIPKLPTQPVHWKPTKTTSPIQLGSIWTYNKALHNNKTTVTNQCLTGNNLSFQQS